MSYLILRTASNDRLGALKMLFPIYQRLSDFLRQVVEAEWFLQEHIKSIIYVL